MITNHRGEKSAFQCRKIEIYSVFISIPLIWTGPEFYLLEEREWSDMLPVQLQTMLFCGWLSIHNSGQWILPSSPVSYSPFVSKLLWFATVLWVVEITPEGNSSAVAPRCMFGSISVCPRVPEQGWELQPSAGRAGSSWLLSLLLRYSSFWLLKPLLRAGKAIPSYYAVGKIPAGESV